MAYTVFGAQVTPSDTELFGSDGTTGRTTLIKNINVSGNANVTNIRSDGSNLPFAVVGNFAYFSADDGINGPELWRTDGNPASGGATTTRVTEFFTTNGADPDITGYNPTNIVAAGGKIYFLGSGPAATSPGTNPPRYGIWMFDPAAYTTPGTGVTFVDSNNGITSLIAVGSRIYWAFDSGSVGVGTYDGTTLVSDISNSVHGELYDAGGTVYVGSLSNSIRKISGTTATTVNSLPAGAPQGFFHTSTHVYIFNIQNTPTLFSTTTGSTTLTPITAAGLTFDFSFSPGGHIAGFAALPSGALIFSNNKTSAGVGANTGSEVWISNGTGATTQVLKDIVPGLGSSNPHNFITVGSEVFFQATNGNGSVELWKTNGTAIGTVLVETLFTGGFDPGSNQIITNLNIENMRVVDGLLYFSFDDKVHGSELWRSDGTAAGTLMLKDLNTSTQGASFGLTPAGVSLGATGVFVGWTPDAGYELFVTNGTPGGTSLLKDIAPGGGNSLPSQFTLAGTRAFFTAYSPTANVELWMTDGTAAGTVLVEDISPNVVGASGPSGMVAFGSNIYFAANNGVNGQELWFSDGTAPGTFMVKDIDTGSSGGSPNSSSPFGFVQSGGLIYFTASTAADGRELWVTDGTGPGTHITKNIGTGNIDANIQFGPIAFNNKVYFSAAESGATSKGLELWMSDGSSGGTVIVKDINTTPEGSGTSSSNPTDIMVVNGQLFFRAQSTGSGSEVYVSNGAAGNATALTATLSTVGTLVAAGNQVFFRGSSPSGEELYVTSGGAATLLDIFPGATGSNAANQMVALGTKVIFAAQNSATNGTELWVSDGSAVGVGTQMVKNINPGANQSSLPTQFVTVGSKVYFVANDGTNGNELWVTDGIVGGAGTHMVMNIGPGATDGQISPLRAADSNHLLFLANDGVNGTEVWITDGTTAFRVTDFVNAGFSLPTGLATTLNGGNTPGGTFASVPFTRPEGPTGETFIGSANPEYFDGLGGDDIFYFGRHFANDDFVNGGAGADTLMLQGNYTAVFGSGASQNVINVENLTLLSGGNTFFGEPGTNRYNYNITMADIFVASGQLLVVNSSGLLPDESLTFNGSAETNGRFTIVAGAGVDSLTGGSGNDSLDGGAGADTVAGGLGNDLLWVDQASDVVIELAGQGTDTVYAFANYTLAGGVHVEVVSAANNSAATALNLTGNELNNELWGTNGANVLDGAGGADVLLGFGGNDVYYVNQLTDAVFENAGQGQDIVYAFANYVLTGGSHVEVLSAANNGAATALNLTGNELNNELWGTNGVNVLNGAGGSDVLIGFAGNDIYYVDALGDFIIDGAGQGNDTVYAFGSYGLTAGAHVEILSAANNGSTLAQDLTGNELVNEIWGTNGANTLNGGGGNDVLIGFGGADLYAFTTPLGSGNVDLVIGFVSGTDKVALDNIEFTQLPPGALAAGAFHNGTVAQDSNDRILYDQTTGALFYDADGNGAGAAVQFATLQGAPPIGAGDFIVI